MMARRMVAGNYAISGRHIMYARIRVIHQANKGLSATRNILIAHAKGTYIAPIDADDWVEPTYLHTLYSLCSRWNVPMAGCNHWLDGTTQAKVRYDQSMPDTLMTAQQACHGVLSTISRRM